MKRLKPSFTLWVVVALLCLLLGFLLGKFKLDILQDSLALMAGDLQTIRAEKIELSKKTARLEASQISDKQTIHQLTQENNNLNDELNLLANKLYFYERVVAPEAQASGVKIYSFSVRKNSVTEQWHYELVLMQAQKRRRLLNGQFALNFSVFENEHLKNVSLSELSETFASTFKFKYFQTIKGVFRLPPEMRVAEVILKLNVAGNRWYKGEQVEQRYNWQTLLEKDDEHLMAVDAQKISNTITDHLTDTGKLE